MESAADRVIDATNLPAADVAERIAAQAEKRIAEADQANAGHWPVSCGHTLPRPGREETSSNHPERVVVTPDRRRDPKR